ncbi:MAG TPA: ATP-binding protein [Anaerolineales bacterium]|nr:ATP-binding protein [Anaerolineales bacterium]
MRKLLHVENPEFDIYPIIAQGMTSNLHWCSEDVPPGELAAILVAMANTEGGTLYLGINSNYGQIEGVRDVPSAVDRLFRSCLLSEPTLVLPVPRTQRVGQVAVLEIIVPQGLPHVFNIEGRYYWREGRHTNPIPARQLRQLLVERGSLQFESQVPADASYEDLDPQQLEAYAEYYCSAMNLPEDHARPGIEEILLQRGCIKKVDGKLQPTYAALLIFGRSPQRWLPAAQILATRFSGNYFGDRFIKQEINGSLPVQLKLAENFLRTNLQNVVRMVGLTHQETLEYPYDAVRELIINSIAHRDYNAQGDCIHLNIFSNRLEITSPGGLPGPITIKNLLEARFSRNPLIVQFLADLGFVERLGYGLKRVVSSMRENSLPPPHFEEASGAFRVLLHNEPDNDLSSTDLSQYQLEGINPRQEFALNYLASRRRITNREYQDLCPDVHQETLRRDLSDLVSRGVLLKIGDKKSTYYILK